MIFDIDGPARRVFGVPASLSARRSRKTFLAALLVVFGAGHAAAQTLYVSSETDNALYSVDLVTGQRLGTPISGASGLLSAPQALALDPTQGSIFVASAGNNRILRYNPDTGVTDLFAGVSSLDSPVGLAFDSGGNLFVSNFGAGNILRFARDASGVLQGGSPTVFASGLTEPYHLAFGPDSLLYVASVVPQGGAELRRYTTTAGAQFGTFSVFSSAVSSGLTAPTGLAFGANGTLFAADSAADTISGYGPSGGAPQSVLAPAAPAELVFPQGLAYSPTTGSLYAANYVNDNILRIDPVTGQAVVLTEGISAPTGLLITAEIPEPSSAALGALGLLGMAGAGAARRVRRRRARATE